jgi:hypothetical protein
MTTWLKPWLLSLKNFVTTNFNSTKKGSNDHYYPIVNNTTKIFLASEKFGQNKFMDNLEQEYALFLKDVEFIRNTFENPLNQPKDVPQLATLVYLLKRKYQHLSNLSQYQFFEWHLNIVDQQLKDMTTKFYKYFFEGKEKPIIIEAISKQSAHHALQQVLPTLKEKGYDLRDLKDMKIETPIVGVSRKQHQGKNFVWSNEGWVQEN